MVSSCMESGAKFLLPRILAHRCGLWTMRITIERWNWFLHFVKENPQTLLKARPGDATVERRTKTNSRNVGVAARRGLLIKKGIREVSKMIRRMNA